MAFHITHRMGNSEADPPLDRLPALLEEFDPEDVEHPDVSVTHESEWCLSAFPSGLLVWENLEEGDPRYVKDVPREKVLQLWELLSRGEIGQINLEPWLEGCG